MTDEEIKKLKDEYESYQGFWKLNESLESQGVYGFIKIENKIKYIEFFKLCESKILNKK
jgi:hypothetical protein